MENFNTNGTSGLFNTADVPPEPIQGQEVIESTPSENFENWDKQKAIDAYKELQRKNTELDRQIKERSNYKDPELENLKQEFAQVKTQLQPPVKVPEKPVKPVKPQKPANYDPADSVTDPTSESYKYRLAKEDYDDKLSEYIERKDEYDEFEKQHINSFLQETVQEKKQNQAKNASLQFLIQGGASEAEAIEIYNTFTPSNNPLQDAKKLVEYHRFLKSGGKQPPVKKEGTPSPVLYPNLNTSTPEESKQFLGEFKQKQTSHLFQTVPK